MPASVAPGIGTGLFSWCKIPRVPSLACAVDGGTPAAVTRLERGHAGHAFPHFLPDGHHFLFFVQGSAEVRGVYVGELSVGTTRRLFDADSAAVYAAVTSCSCGAHALCAALRCLHVGRDGGTRCRSRPT